MAEAAAHTTARKRRLDTGALWMLLPVFAAFAVFLPRITRGGFTGDDWSNQVISRQRSPLDLLESALRNGPFGHRALHQPYVSVYDRLFDGHVALYLAWAVLTAGALGGMVALLLRRAGSPAWVAGSIGALGVIYPYATITKIWATAHIGHVSASIAIAGVLAVAAAFERPFRTAKAIGLHLFGLLCFVVSLDLYEIALPLLCLTGPLYLLILRRRGPVPLRSVGTRWVVDLALVAVWYLSIRGDTDIASTTTPLGERVGTIVGDGLRNLVGSFVPFLSAERGADGQPLYSGAHFPVQAGVVLLVSLLVLAAILIVAGRRRTGLAGWGVGVLGALFSAFAGWLAIVPAADYYRPVPFDAAALRVNVLAAFGLAATVVCVVGGVLALVRRWVRASPTLFGVAAAAVLVVVAAAYARHDRAEVALWNDASAEQERVLGRVGQAYGSQPPAPDTAVFLTDNKEYIADGAEVFYTSWSFRAALQLHYGDFTLEGVAHRTVGQYACRRSGLLPYYLQYRQGQPSAIARYGKLDLVSVDRAKVWHVRDQRDCRRLVSQLLLGVPQAGRPMPAPGTT